MRTPDTTEGPDGPARHRHFEHLDPDGPVRAYVGTLTDRRAETMRTLLEGDPSEQAEAKETLARHGAAYALVRQFGDAYYECALSVGHTIALDRVTNELGAMLKHIRSRHSDALLEDLETIRDCYDGEYRRATATVPISPSSD